jgi:hypothetical protein
LKEERAFTVSSLILLPFRTSGTPFALMYHLSSLRKTRGEPSRTRRAHPAQTALRITKSASISACQQAEMLTS